VFLFKEVFFMHKTLIAAGLALSVLACGPAQAGWDNGTKVNGTKVNGAKINGKNLNGGGSNGIDPNGIDPNGIDPNGVNLNGGGSNAQTAKGAAVATDSYTNVPLSRVRVSLPPAR